MHEMSLAQGILDLVEQSAQREGFVRVQQLHLEVGALAGVEISALQFALDTMSQSGVLHGAQMVIDTPPAQAWCMQCSQTVEIIERGQACPRCGSYQIQATTGTELRVVDMVVID